MPEVRYVCLSDLHPGAQNSLLTNPTADGQVPDPRQQASDGPP
jgi:hypothetical protein